MSESLRQQMERAANALASFIGECPLIAEEKRPGFDSRMEEIQRAIEAADRPLRLALLGGTGVGKSTIVNALAGREISPGSRRRPTTTRIVVYAHKSWAPDLPLDEADQVRRHEEEAIRDLLIIDFPDFDSLREEGRKTVDSYLPQMDQILWVVDKEKYNDRRLHDGYIRREAPYRQNFLFLFNKVDAFGAGEELDVCVEDLKRTLESEGIESPLLFRISAKEALSHKEGDGEGETAEFKRFEEHLQTRYTEKYREEIRRANVVKALGSLASEVEAIVQPAERGERIRKIRADLARAEKSLREAGERLLVDEVLSRERRRALADAFQRKHLEDLPGIVGMIAEFRIFGKSGPSPYELLSRGKGPQDASGGVHSPFDGAEESGGARRFYTLLANAARDIEERLGEFTGAGEPMGKIGLGEEAFREKLRVDLGRIRDEARKAQDDPRFRRKGTLVQHVLPWGAALAIVGFTIWFRQALEAEGALHWVLIEVPVALVLLYVTEAAFAHRTVRRAAQEKAEALREMLSGSVRALVSEDIVKKSEMLFSETEKVLTDWRQVESTLEKVTHN